MIPGSANPLLLAGAEEAAFKIDRSLRFNSADSAYLNRTPSSAGNRKTWTFSAWIKRSLFGASKRILRAVSGSTEAGIQFLSGEKIELYDYSGGYTWQLNTSALFRDPSAWYHIVVAFDTTQATAADRVSLYVNGSEVTDFSTSTYPSQNFEGLVNNNVQHALAGQDSLKFDGYLADVHFIDGQALAASDFGKFDDNNVWQPKAYSGSYGTNGFHLDFSDNSSNAALGYDAAGSNDWTVNNLQAVTPSASYDSSYGSDITSTEAAKIFDSDDSTYGVATGDFIGFVYGGTAVRMKVENTSGSQVDFYIQPNVSSNPENSGTWSNQSAGTVSVNRWFIPANTTATAIFTFPGTWDGNGRIYTSNQYANLRFYSMDTSGVDSAAVDSLIDTPTDYEAASGNNGGNYCTLNPLQNSGVTLSNGNLDVTGGGNWYGAAGTFGMSSGKWYFEYDNVVSNEHIVGIVPASTYTLNTASSYAYGAETGGKYSPSASNVSYGDSWTTGDVIGVAFDADAGNLYFYKNGTIQNSGTAAFTGLTDGPYLPSAVLNGSSRSASLNFGQRPFSQTVPTGYSSLVTTNSSDPTIADGSTAFDTKLWTGNGSSQSISTSFSPDFVWVKERGSTGWHNLYDTVRGVKKGLITNDTRAEATYNDGVTAFGTDSFTVSHVDASTIHTNSNNDTYVGWAWDAGTSTVSNTDGTITSSVRANASAGFSIVSYTGDGNSATIGHGLNAAPEFIIQKRRSQVQDWNVYHSANGKDKSIILNSTAASYSSTTWNNTAPTSSVFSIVAVANPSGQTHIAYCFAPVEGYSAFGSYTGNGSADGPFMYTGMRPRFILIKRSSATENWMIIDTARDTYNVGGTHLMPNNNLAEGTSTPVDHLSNGFKLRTTSTAMNASGSTYIWAAFSEHPFKTARAR